MALHRWRLSIVTGSALALCLACEKPSSSQPPSEPAPTQSPTPAAADCPPLQPSAGAVLADLAAKAERQGHLRVIARLSAADRVQPSAGDIHSAAIATLKSAGVEDAKPISARLPYVVAEVTAEELKQVFDNERFSAWSEDHITYPTLVDSAPLVQATDLWMLGGRGKGQAVAILDTGVDKDHPFLSGRVVAEACFSTTSVINRSTSVCPNGQSSQIAAGAAKPCTADGCEHGTHVAGIAAGRGTDFSGMAPDADIVAVQVFSQFTGAACRGTTEPCIASFTSDQIRALDYVLQNSGGKSIAAANLSLGGGYSATACDTDLSKPVMDQLRSAGVATVIASGNESLRNGVSYPGCVSTAITVGATTKQDKLAAFSNCGVQVDLHAPGVGIVSSIPGGGFATFSGTSMATPHVTGAIAALRSLHPSASLDQIEDALKSTGLPVGGRPRIRLLAANEVLDRTAPKEPPVSIAQDENPELNAFVAQLSQLPQDRPVRLIVGVEVPPNASPAAVRTAVSKVEEKCKKSGAKVERLGSQPTLVVEATAAQARTLLQTDGVVSVQFDRVTTTQDPK